MVTSRSSSSEVVGLGSWDGEVGVMRSNPAFARSFYLVYASGAQVLVTGCAQPSSAALPSRRHGRRRHIRDVGSLAPCGVFWLPPRFSPWSYQRSPLVKHRSSKALCASENRGCPPKNILGSSPGAFRV